VLRIPKRLLQLCPEAVWGRGVDHTEYET
jgi:hypothetical protein